MNKYTNKEERKKKKERKRKLKKREKKKRGGGGLEGEGRGLWRRRKKPGISTEPVLNNSIE